jgi:hypothetical protein
MASNINVSSGSGQIYGIQNVIGTLNIYSSTINVTGTTGLFYAIYNTGTLCGVYNTPTTAISGNVTGTNYGVYNSGSTGIMDASPITVTLTAPGTQTAYGLYNTNAVTGFGNLTVSDSPITVSSYNNAIGAYNLSGSLCTVNSTPIIASSPINLTGGLIGGVWNVGSTGSCVINNSSVNATTGAAGNLGFDISQTSGSITLNGATKLFNNTTNTHPFTSAPSSFLVWSVPVGITPTLGGKYLMPGASTSGTGYGSYTGTAITAPHPLIIKNLTANTVLGTGPVLTLYKNGVSQSTLVSTTVGLTGYGQSTTGVASFTGGDLINMAIAGGTGSAGLNVTVEVY